MSSLTTPTSSGNGRIATSLDELDQRYHPAAGLRKQFNKVFPTHWSFMLGEVALYSFIVLLLSGTYLALFFDPSMEEVVYDGPFENLRGIHMSRAYESVLEISFDVRHFGQKFLGIPEQVAPTRDASGQGTVVRGHVRSPTVRRGISAQLRC